MRSYHAIIIIIYRFGHLTAGGFGKKERNANLEERSKRRSSRITMQIISRTSTFDLPLLSRRNERNWKANNENFKLSEIVNFWSESVTSTVPHRDSRREKSLEPWKTGVRMRQFY